MSQPISNPYIEPMALERRSHHRKRSDSGYGGNSSDRSSRLSGGRRSNESTTGFRGYIESEMNMQQCDVRALQNALQASNESREKLDKERFDLDQELAASHRENKRLRSERDAARKQNDELRASSSSAYNDHSRKELAKSQKESKKSSGKSNSKVAKEAWRDLPVPLYNNREQSPPEMPRTPTSRPTSSSRAQRRMSTSQAPWSYTYTVQPMH